MNKAPNPMKELYLEAAKNRRAEAQEILDRHSTSPRVLARWAEEARCLILQAEAVEEAAAKMQD